MATIGQHYFKVCTRGAERSGLDRLALLAAAGIDPADLDVPGWRGSVEAMSELVRTICRSLDDEFMGFADRKAKPGTFAMMTQLALTAPTALNALKKGIDFYNLVTDAFPTGLEQNDDSVVLRMLPSRPEFDPDHYFVEFWMMGWHRFACWLAGETVPINQVELAYPKPASYLHELAHLFPAEWHFDSDNYRLHLSRSALSTAVMPVEVDRRRMVQRAPFDFMTMPGSDHSLTRRVRALLVPRADAPFEALRVDEIAAAVDLHPVSLSRQLRGEGTSVSRIIEGMRRDLAITQLMRGATVEAVAARLGYDEARSFTRAFRAWTGFSPRQYRALAVRDRPC